MENSKAIPNVPPTELDTLPEGYTLLDVREQDEWDAGHAPTAVHIPMGDVPARVAELPDGPIAVICRVGGRSMKVATWLDQFGYEVSNIDGGMTAWHEAGLEMVRDDGGEPEVI